MNIYYLYVKTHKKTGLKYLGQTSKPDPYKYKGSGTYWLNHLNRHGYTYDTEILHRCVSKAAIRSWGLFYSRLWSVVDSTKWANLKEENGDGGGCRGTVNGMYGKTHTPEIKNMLGDLAHDRFAGKSYDELYGKEKADELRSLRSQSALGKDNSFSKNPRYDSTSYTFYNVATGDIVQCTRWVFYNNYSVSKGSVSEMINNGESCRGWVVIHP